MIIYYQPKFGCKRISRYSRHSHILIVKALGVALTVMTVTICA